jgi:hypothetical protein
MDGESSATREGNDRSDENCKFGLIGRSSPFAAGELGRVHPECARRVAVGDMTA